MSHMSDQMRSCVDECLRCYQTCLGTAMNHCLETGGKHVEPAHERTLVTASQPIQSRQKYMFKFAFLNAHCAIVFSQIIPS